MISGKVMPTDSAAWRPNSRPSVEPSNFDNCTEGRLFGRQAALSVGITLPLMIVGIMIRKHLARGFSFGMVRR